MVRYAMTIEICGMTLEEIEAKTKLFDRAERRNRQDAKKMCKKFLDIVYFASAEEYDFAKKMSPEFDKVYDEAKKALDNSADEKEKEELRGIMMRIGKLIWRCDERLWELEMEPAILWCESTWSDDEDEKKGE